LCTVSGVGSRKATWKRVYWILSLAQLRQLHGCGPAGVARLVFNCSVARQVVSSVQLLLVAKQSAYSSSSEWVSDPR